ncbi:MAG: methionyl-tRNA formyltransferase [Candidatus Omnitrophica bacterium]|nr:methionyl-tRNA formyltransferase [Candidatus Omnitrophota bacterium]
MKIIFWGTSHFATPSLEEVSCSGHEILSVVTQPDKKQGRHLELKPPPVKTKAVVLRLEVVQPEDIRSREFIEYLEEKKADLFVIVSYGKILPREILAIPKFYTINLHASLLPRYRGAAPINWAILNGEQETGLSIFKVTERMDAGEIILQKRIAIFENEDAITLGERLSKEGARLLKEAIDLIEEGRAVLIPQDENEVSFAPLLKKEDGRIDWNNPAVKIYNQTRALVPWPGSFCRWHNKLLKIWKTQVVEGSFLDAQYGEIVDINKDGFIVKTGQGGILIKELQLEGGKRMSAEKFLLGHQLGKGELLT